MSLNQDQLAGTIETLSSMNVAALLNSSSGQFSGLNADSKQDLQVHPLSVDLKGLESMHDPGSTSMLYVAPSDRSDILSNFCLALQKHFQEFLAPDDRPSKLHATIVNTIYAKSKKPADRSQGHGPKAKGSLKINAKAILQKYQDYVWVENLTLDRIAICEMGAKKTTDAAKVRVLDERYTEVASASLPS